MSRYLKKTSRWPLRPSRLAALDVELTERCNNNCIHCCINRAEDDRAAKSREMSTDRIKRHLKEAADLGCLQVRFTGGEPLLREDFEELYVHARRLGLRVLLFTNARLITPALADLFARVPPLVEIEISVYGMTPESYNAVARVPGAFTEFRGGVDLLLERRVPFVVKWIPLPPNFDEFESFTTWIKIIPWMRQPPGGSVVLQLRGRRDNLEKNAAIARLRRDSLKDPARSAAPSEKSRRELADFCRRFLGPPGDHLFTCGVGDAPCIDAYGRLQPCLDIRVPELTLDLKRGIQADTLSGFLSALRAVKAADPEYLKRCARCFLKGLCEQCPARSWTEHGVLDKPVEYLCAIAHEQARGLGLLEIGENAWDIPDWEKRIGRLGRKRKVPSQDTPGLL